MNRSNLGGFQYKYSEKSSIAINFGQVVMKQKWVACVPAGNIIRHYVNDFYGVL